MSIFLNNWIPEPEGIRKTEGPLSRKESISGNDQSERKTYRLSDFTPENKLQYESWSSVNRIQVVVIMRSEESCSGYYHYFIRARMWMNQKLLMIPHGHVFLHLLLWILSEAAMKQKSVNLHVGIIYILVCRCLLFSFCKAWVFHTSLSIKMKWKVRLFCVKVNGCCYICLDKKTYMTKLEDLFRVW